MLSLKKIGIINSITKLHLFGISTEQMINSDTIRATHDGK
jgi:hypothetical protein